LTPLVDRLWSPITKKRKREKGWIDLVLHMFPQKKKTQKKRTERKARKEEKDGQEL
jgi:hypothetical protein